MAKRKERDDDADDAPRESARLRPSIVKDKTKRSELMAKLRREKTKEKKKRIKERNKAEEEAIALGEELLQDEEADEFAAHFNRVQTPRVLITTCPHPHKVVYPFIGELLCVIPDAIYYRRAGYPLKKIVEYATNGDFTAMIVIHENRNRINGMLIISLPEGPTAHFRVSSVVLGKKIKGHGRPTHHKPELILNNFDTRLGHRLGRMIASLFPQDPQFRGRRSVTFHNQRDFIFFRHHRFIQECGPRFTLKLMSIQKGTFDTKHGEFEWIRKASLGNGRKQFYL
ncbi:hypothetical protein CBR_g19066 [Chara braunii]|uniref:Brix domain-containing protein n=1 Tax=Chara braunii TaxID=69332 RepID=A0A388KXB2_CHABU|nr:hypothetical protein CBR_g19066 [Chara braunii]|eukprot:GBG74658.1 hypothetical protein CBR_g19066 [Chara braunii]